jgi:membrane-associated protein
MHVATAAAGGLNLLDPHSLLADLGTLGVFLVLFAETGLLVGFFLPGDSLLFTAGLLSTTAAGSSVHLSLPIVLFAAAAGALLGAQVGYPIGRRIGPAMLDRADRPRLRHAVSRSAAALDRYGAARAIVLARFIPLMRTVLNPMAGTVRVSVRVFTTWQVVGGLLWSVGVTFAGYLLRASIPNLDTYLLPIVAMIIAASLAPLALEIVRNRSNRPVADAPERTTVDAHSTGHA